MLAGRLVDLKTLEREDLPTWQNWFVDPEFAGPWLWYPRQTSLQETEKVFLDQKPDQGRFLVVTKDGRKVGVAVHFNPSTLYEWMEIGYRILTGERGKGYATEATQILVDYLFLTRTLERIQATTEAENVGSQRVLLKAGFRKEGDIRRGWMMWGTWRDGAVFSILREEWKGPHVLRTLDAAARTTVDPAHMNPARPAAP